ncbi:MAG: PAS domain-containing protein [Cyclobacteriaceae bacterium]|nr:PAS domain-containing protein [Cyclobacteriaceae bacterium]
MGTPLKILVVEDVETDALLLLRQFRNSEYTVTSRRVDSIIDVNEALRTRWDLVLSDFRLPGFDAFDVLPLVRKQDIDVPFILVSGTVGDEIAVKLIKAGAQDCFSKGNLQRLMVVVKRELTEAEIRRAARRATEELKTERLRFALAVKGSSDGIWDWEIERESVYFSPRYRELLGFDPIVHFGSNDEIDASVHPEDKPRFQQHLQLHLDKDQPFQIECRFKTMDRGYRWFLMRGQALWDSHGKPVRMSGSLTDIHDRKVVEAANARLLSIVEAGRELVASAEPDGRLLYMNAAGRKILRIPREIDITTKHISDFHPPGVIESVLEIAVKECIEFGYWTGETTFRRWDGSTFPGLHSILAHVDVHGNIIGLSTVVRDISDWKQVETEIKSLNRSLSDFQRAVTSSSIVTRSGKDHRITFVNDNFCHVSGYKPSEVIGQNHRILNSGFHSDSFFEEMHQFIQSGRIWHREILNRKKSGEPFWLDMHIIPFVDESGEVTEYMSLSTDITDRKRAEREILQQNQLLREAYRVAKMGHWVRESAYVKSSVSAEVLELYGVSVDQFARDPAILYRMTHPDDLEQVNRKLEQAFLLKSGYESEHRIILKGGKVRWVYQRAAFREIDGQEQLVGITQDNTELVEYRRHLEDKVLERTRDLDEALRKEKELTEMKTRFVNTASHEFRTPLTTIHIASGYLRKYHSRLDSADLMGKLEVIDRQVATMIRLLDDVLMIGKTEPNKVQVVLSRISIEPFVELIVRQVEEQSARHSIAVVLDSDLQFIQSDEKLLLSILLNLLTNAVKYSPDAPDIQLTIGRSGEECKITITDHGIGIPDKELPQIFESFLRGSNVGTIPGTGLGLAIVKDAVERLHGRITIESKVAQGTTFSVWLPLVA